MLWRGLRRRNVWFWLYLRTTFWFWGIRGGSVGIEKIGGDCGFLHTGETNGGGVCIATTGLGGRGDG